MLRLIRRDLELRSWVVVVEAQEVEQVQKERIDACLVEREMRAMLQGYLLPEIFKRIRYIATANVSRVNFPRF